MFEESLAPFVAAVFGLLIGSFLNVCIYRLPRKQSVVAPRSFCPRCERPIAWYDNIPVLSYLLLRGRCRVCHARIPIRYPLVEVATAAFYYAVLRHWGLHLEGAKWLLFGSILIVLFWTDLERRLLPDVLTLGGLAAALIFALFVPVQSEWTDMALRGSGTVARSEAAALGGALLLSLPFLLFSEIYTRIRGIMPAGFGDTKLLAMLGAFLGPDLGAVTLFIGSVGGLIVAVGYIFGTGKNPREELLPFGTFFCAAGFIVLFWGQQIFALWWNSGTV